MLFIFIGMFGFIFSVYILSNTNQLLQLPLTTPVVFLSNMPHLKITLFSHDLILIQPSSTIFVYSLGIIMILVGVYFYFSRNKHKSRSFWGFGLILWGIGAIVAGTSYQAFGYELKCKGREYCLFTSNFELIYMLLTAYCINYLVAATGYTSLGQIGRKRIIRFAIIDSVLYSIYMLIGAIVPIKFLISYEGFMAFIGINFVVMLILNIRHYIKFKDSLNLRMIIIWISFLIVNIGYFMFLFGGFGSKLYEGYGAWFNENDVLHILLILWAILNYLILRKKMVDTNW